MSTYEAREAAQSLADGLAELTRLREEEAGWTYEIPERLRDNIRAVSREIRDAVRALVSADADDDAASPKAVPVADTLTPTVILSLPMRGNNVGAATIREYLVTLLRAVWEQGEGFSGKRPFGESDWAHDLYEPLVIAGAVPGRLDDDGFLYEVDVPVARAVILGAIDALAGSL